MTFVLKVEMDVKLIKFNQSKVTKLLTFNRLIVSIVTIHIFIPLNWYGWLNIVTKFFGTKFVERC